MRVLLVNPPSANEIVSCNPKFLNEERGYTPPLGILYLASYVKKFSDFEVQVLDCQAEKVSYADLPHIIEIKRPDVIGITAMTFTLIDALKFIEIVKKINPQIIIVLGGPHPHIYPEETINFSIENNLCFSILSFRCSMLLTSLLYTSSRITGLLTLRTAPIA